jgi:hypothetical protein
MKKKVCRTIGSVMLLIAVVFVAYDYRLLGKQAVAVG